MVEIKVVLVEPDIIPMSGQHFHRQGAEIVVDIEHFLDLGRKISRAGLGQHGDEMSQIAVIILLGVGDQLVGAAIADHKFILIGIAAAISEVGRPEAFE